LVCLLVLLFPNSYTIFFWEFYLLPFCVHVQTNLILVILVDAIKNLVRFDGWGSVSCGMKCKTDDYDIRQWMCHNCSCGTIAVHQLTIYRNNIENIFTEGLRNTFWGSVGSLPLCSECSSLSRWSSLTDI
jgi:hypothetical protein